MNPKIGGPGWDRTNDQPIMSPEGSRPTRSSDVNPNTTCPTDKSNKSTVVQPDRSDWQSRLAVKILAETIPNARARTCA
jgi:hypothetical protein